MKIEHQIPWAQICAWAGKMFPYPAPRFRSRIESTYSTYCRLFEKAGASESDRLQSYSTVNDLEFVGSHCSQLGLNRSNLLDLCEAPRVLASQVSNGVVYELRNFCKKEALSPDYMNIIFEAITGTIVKTVTVA